MCLLLAGVGAARAIDAPQFQPDSKGSAAFLSVTISCATPGAEIRYTTTGADPVVEDQARPSPVTVQIKRPVTLKASAWVGSSASAISSATYVVSGGVASGDKFSAALRADGRVWTWGEGSNGHLGHGAPSRTTPAMLSSPANVIALSSGSEHTLVIVRGTASGAPQDRGTVWAWGFNASGRLGDGTTATIGSPVQVLKGAGDPLADITAVSAGAAHSLALDKDGRVWAWGDNGSGRLGLGSSFTGASSAYAKQVPGLANVIAIAAGGTQSIALAEDPVTKARTLYAWGSNASGLLGIGNVSPASSASPVAVNLPVKAGTSQKIKVVGIAAGNAHNVIVDADGWVYAWGNNPAYRLGVGSSNSAVTAPARVTELPGTKKFDMVAAGETFSVALDEDGGVYVWGDNESGQFGNGNRTDPGTAFKVPLAEPARVVAAGSHQALAVLDDGLIAVWGNNQNGQLGIGLTLYSTSPEEIGTYATGSGSVTAGTGHTLALTADGSLLAWGDNVYGQLGLNLPTGTLSPASVALPNTLAVSTGDRHSLALVRNSAGVNQVYAWGSNANGRLGLGNDASNRLAPVNVNVPNAVAVSAGFEHSLALTEDPITHQRRLFAWGSNAASRLGDGGTGQQFTPEQITVDVNGSALPALLSVSAGESHSLAVSGSGTVFAWGNNTSGRLGNGASSGSVTRPVQIPSFTGVAAVAAGFSHSLAVKSNGQVWAWGNNGSGRLGDGTSTARYSPVQVLRSAGVPLTNVIAVAAGSEHSLALDSSGSVWSWGNNSWGQLGDGTFTNTKYAKKVPGLTDVVAIAAGDQHSVALTAAGKIIAWGYNLTGQLGDGAAGYLFSPVLGDDPPRLVNWQDSDGDDVLDWEEMEAGTDPDDYYNGVAPTLAIVSGNNQTGSAETFLSEPLRIQITRSATSAALPNAPVTFNVLSNGGVLAASPSSASLGTSADLKTDSQGYSSIYFKPGSLAVGQVKATAGRAHATFSTNTSDSDDLNGNGIPDTWELDHFPALLAPGEADGDADHDGSSNFEEFQRGTDPNDNDSDDDGAPDGGANGADLYPLDPNRSENIDVTQLAAIDISGTSANGEDVKTVALGDDGHASFWNKTAEGDYHVTAWADGAVAQEGTLSLHTQQTSGEWQTTYDLRPPEGVSAGGVVVGSGTMTVIGPGGYNKVESGSYSWDVHAQDIQFDSERFYQGITAEGVLWGRQTETWELCYQGWFDVLVDNVLFIDEAKFPRVTDYDGDESANTVTVVYGRGRMDPATISSDGKKAAGIYSPILGSGRFTKIVDADQEDYTVNDHEDHLLDASKKGFRIWMGGEEEEDAQVPFPDSNQTVTAVATNNAGTTIGSSPNVQPASAELPADSGWIWTADGTTRSIRDVLPIQNRKQIRNIVPELISNPIFAGGNAVYIVFEGENLEGPKGGEQWVRRRFLLTLGDINTVAILSSPTGVADLALKSINAFGIVSAVGTAPVTGKKRSYLLLPMEFTTSEITKGFDYPLQGDPPDPSSPLGQHNGEKDDTKPEWWTSIGQGPLYGEGLNVNNHVKADVGSYGAARILDIRVKPGNEKIIDLLPVKLAGKETPLTITGKNLLAPLPTWAEIEIVDKSPTPQVVRTLKVMSLIKWELPIRVCFVYDPRFDPADPARADRNQTRVAQAFQNTQQIVEHLNRAFQQSCVQFYAADGSGTVPLAYDTNGNFRLDWGNGNVMQDTELKPFLDSGYFDPYTPTIFVVGEFQQYLNISNPPRPPHRTIGFNAKMGIGPGSPWVFIDSGFFRHYPNPNDVDGYLNDCAHEIGHVLGISTRHYGGRASDGYTDWQHDAGVHPLRYGNTRALMDPAPQDIWIRYEDWYHCNNGAKDRAGALPQ